VDINYNVQQIYLPVGFCRAVNPLITLSYRSPLESLLDHQRALFMDIGDILRPFYLPIGLKKAVDPLKISNFQSPWEFPLGQQLKHIKPGTPLTIAERPVSWFCDRSQRSRAANSPICLGIEPIQLVVRRPCSRVWNLWN
jgi:hypothetical protein